MKTDVNVKDIIFVVVFSTLIFFGAFFLFSSLKKPTLKKQVSVRSLERDANRRINKKIQMLQTRDRIYKSKISRAAKVDVDEILAEEVDVKVSKYDLDVFERQAPEVRAILPQNASEKIMALIDREDQSETEKQNLIEEYKEQIIRKARAQGWAIEIDDDLQVTSAKQL